MSPKALDFKVILRLISDIEKRVENVKNNTSSR